MTALRDLRLPVLRRKTPPMSACRACKLPIPSDDLYCRECMERPVQPGFGPVCIDCGNLLNCVCEVEKNAEPAFAARVRRVGLCLSPQAASEPQKEGSDMNDHALRNAQQVRVLQAALTGSTLGSGYRPTAWCLNGNCHEPIDVHAINCPHCSAGQNPLHMTPIQLSPVVEAYFAREGLGMITVRRGGVMVARRIFEVQTSGGDA